jgi:hypothetical protein
MGYDGWKHGKKLPTADWKSHCYTASGQVNLNISYKTRAYIHTAKKDLHIFLMSHSTGEERS